MFFVQKSDNRVTTEKDGDGHEHESDKTEDTAYRFDLRAIRVLRHLDSKH